MGIRFYCPNGHKMNVKEFQAGRHGVCPICGAKMQIPHSSTRPSSKPDSPSLEDDPTTAPVETLRMPSQPSAAPALPVKAADRDPLNEIVHAIWYVRPTSGGQFGPAPAELMRVWLDERRITADALVWRQDWNDWRRAGEVFPELSQQLDQTDLTLDDALSDTEAVASTRYAPRVREPKNPWILISVLLSLVAVLSGLLVWALWFR
ncbi:MAG: DUF4339 domain-containing protein [Thermoguttaceae bacterium]